MGVREILTEILEQYSQEYANDNKVSSPYYKDLKYRIKQVFEPLLDEFGLKINALGGQGVMRKTPYICFLAEGHRTNRGIYPNYHFDLGQQLVSLGIGDADDNPPLPGLVNQFITCSCEPLQNFQSKNKDGYPKKVYAKSELHENKLLEDLKAIFEVYQLCLDEFDEDIQGYLQESKTNLSVDRKDVIWAIQAGTGGRFWDEWQQHDCISIGWSKLGNLSHLPSVKEAQTALLEAYPTEINKEFPHMTYINDAHTVNNFVNRMQVGDMVAAIKGRHTILGIGKITGKYEYTHVSQLSDPDHPNIRKVQWFKTIGFETDHGLPLKTLTPLYPSYTNYQRIVEYINEDSTSSLTSEQMNFLIDNFLEWYEHDRHREEEVVEEYQRFSKEYFLSLNDQELIEVMFQFAREGGKIQSGGYRTASMFRESIENRVSEFRQNLLEIFSEGFDAEKWWNKMDAFKGFGKGIRSILLHRIFQDRYTIFNNKSRDAYQMLGLLAKKKSQETFEYGLINEAARRLIAYRPDKLNFYRVDAMTHFLIGTNEGQQAFQMIQKSSSPEINYWWLNANPKIWDFNNLAVGAKDSYTSHNEQGHKRQVYNAFEAVKPGDIVLGYVTSPQREIVAICKITQGLHTREEGKSIEFEKLQQLEHPVHFDELQNIPELQNCRPLLNNQGSLFPITPEEYKIIHAIIQEKNPYFAPDHPEVIKNLQYPLKQCAEKTGFDLHALEKWKRAIKRKKQAIFYGPPGTGKTFLAEELAKHLIGGGDGFVEIVQFHPAYAYEDFVQGIRPKARDGGGLDYPTVPGRFLEFCQEAQRRNDLCVLIIDEINRANLARVFGELMYLLEYRTKDVRLASGEFFRIPENVRFIGTMNTADRSIALVDYALRRRFAFLALYPDYEVLRRYHDKHQTGFPVDKLISVLKQLNTKIGDHHYYVGISFFLDQNLAEFIPDVWQMEIEPYLEEFFFDQSDTVEEFRWDKIASKVIA